MPCPNPPPQRSEQGSMLLNFPPLLPTLPPTAAEAPINPCLKFLSGIHSISIDWGRPRTLVGSMNILHLKSIKEEEKTEEIHPSREAVQHVFNTRTKIKREPIVFVPAESEIW